MKRCQWVDESKIEYVRYHDDEWGVPVYDDNIFFEFLILESAQAGLNWYSILKRRAGYREAFAHFDPVLVSKFDAEKVEQLLQNTDIIRNRKKIEAAINNAQRFLEVQQQFGSFNNYVWEFVENIPPIKRTNKSIVQVTTKQSDLLSHDLKKRGFTFLGSITIYAFMQATGLVNDHDPDCFRWEQ